MRDLIELLNGTSDLSTEQINAAAESLLSADVPDDEKADFLSALAAKGETPDEIAGFVRAFLSRAVDPGISVADCPGPTVDVCGTGGDKLDLFNVSTATVFVLAGGGATVVKHGNRGITSKSGGADVLESLGVRIDQTPDELRECVLKHGVGFLFAPLYHPAFKAVVGVRQQLAAKGTRTIFNLIGPLLNPCRPDYQLVGVFDRAYARPFAEILSKLGRKRAWAVHGEAPGGLGMDELSLSGTTAVAEWDGSAIVDRVIDPREFGLELVDLDDLRGGDPAQNAAILRAVLDGSERGAKRDIVRMNAAAGFAICGLTSDFGGGLELASEVIDDGRALSKLDSLRSA